VRSVADRKDDEHPSPLFLEHLMRTRLIRTALATAAVVSTLGLAGCSSDAAGDSAPVVPQELRNDAAEELAAARQATLVPVGTRLELLRRAEQRAQLAGDTTRVTAVEATLAEYRELAASVEAAASADVVRAVVEQADLDLGAVPAPDVQG
jgi:hypothetical protein